MDIDSVLDGSTDLHAHGFPEVGVDFPGPGDMQSCYEWAREAREVGMDGFLIKSHFFSSATLAHNVNIEVDGIEVYGSTVLNQPSGGIDELTAEISGRLDATIVYMPTWSAQYDIDCGGFSSHVEEYYKHFETETFDGTTILDDDGELTPEVLAVLDELSKHDVTVGTGHIAPEESLALADAASERDVPIVFDHPTSPSTNATVEQAREMAEKGALAEFVALATVGRFKRLDYPEFAQWIRDVGVDNSLLATDAFSPDAPSPPELMREGIEALAEAGFSEAELETLVKTNPRRVL